MTGFHEVARRVAAGTASNAVGRVLILLGTIAVTPIIVHAVGATDYGVWILISSLASIGGVLELGISAGLVKYVAEHAARDEVDEAAHIVAAATWLYTLLAVFFLLVGLGLAVAVPLALGLEAEAKTLARTLGALAAIDLGLSMLSLAPMSMLKGLQRFPVVNAVQVATSAVAVVLTVVVIEVGGGIVSVSAVWVATRVIAVAMYAIVARRTFPEYMAVSRRRDLERVGRLVRFSRSIAAVQVAVNMQGRLDAVVIGAALPVREVAGYSFAQRLADGTRLATDQFGKVLLPLASEVSATRERGALRELFLTSTRLTLGIAFGVGVPVALLGGPILDVWVGDEFSGYGGVVTILACAAIVDLPSYPAAAVLQSIERHGPIAWMAMGSAVANVGLSIALVGPYGVEGVAAGTLIASAVEVVVFVVPYTARLLEVSPGDFVSQVLLPLLVPVATLALLLLGGHELLPVTSLPRLVLVVGGSIAVYAVMYVAVGAAGRERAVYRAAASAVLRRAKRTRS